MQGKLLMEENARLRQQVRIISFEETKDRLDPGAGPSFFRVEGTEKESNTLANLQQYNLI